MFAFADFVKATTTTTGTGDITLASSPTGFRSFADGFTDGDVTDVLVVDNPSAPTQWEVFEATYNDLATDTLTRGTLRSSSTGSRINFSAGTKTVVPAPSALFFNIIAQSINANIDATGSSGAYAVTTPAGLAPARGYRITFKANHDNPAGGTTINPDTLGADAIKMSDGSDPYAGAIKNGGLYTVEFDGTNFQLLNPSPVANSWVLVNRQTAAYSSWTTNSTTGAFGDNKMTWAEGALILSAAITPRKTTNRLKITVQTFLGHTNAGTAGVQAGLFQNASGTDAAIAQANTYQTSAGIPGPVNFVHEMAAGTTSSTTFAVRVAASAASVTVNGVGGSRVGGGNLVCRLIIEEYEQI